MTPMATDHELRRRLREIDRTPLMPSHNLNVDQELIKRCLVEATTVKSNRHGDLSATRITGLTVAGRRFLDES